jgi:geranylgeranyl diphosphate synthase, type I
LSAHRGEADEATTRRVASLKSGSYTVADPLAIGALLADADDATVSLLESYGRPLGEAFQIRDDVLGTFGDPAMTGKESGGDLREGKQTVLLAKTYALANEEQRKILDAHTGDADMRPDDADRVREIIVVTGALDETNRLVAELTAQAKSALTSGSIDDEAHHALLLLADESTTRHS